jgi:signal transduction histidine kinase
MPSRPEAIDSRLVFRIYAAAALPLGIAAFSWPLLVPEVAPTYDSIVPVRLAASVVTALGTCAAAFARIDDPLGRQRGLMGFAHAHIMMGVMLVAQSRTPWAQQGLPLLSWAAVIAGCVLLYLAITGPGTDFLPALPRLEAGREAPARGFAIRNRRTIARLRSEYEEQIRQAARQEERARLARDLHDAVKQQLFVIQTAGATAQARFEHDRSGALDAIAQVRSAAREAMTEMEAMLDQLQGAPIENAGLVALLRRQCEALGFQTGARVNFSAGTLPPPAALDPAARQTIARVAQEALSNVARHARAASVDVTLETVEGRVVLTVKDDGCGFEPATSDRPGMGLSNIAVRAAEVGGSVDVVGAPGHGTTLRFAVPCAVASPSPRPYVARAAFSSMWLIIGLVMLSRETAIRPVWLAVGLIAAIAAARYTVAAVVRIKAWRAA